MWKVYLQYRYTHVSDILCQVIIRVTVTARGEVIEKETQCKPVNLQVEEHCVSSGSSMRQIKLIYDNLSLSARVSVYLYSHSHVSVKVKQVKCVNIFMQGDAHVTRERVEAKTIEQ